MKLINFSELRQILGGRGRTSVYRDIQQGRLPEPIKFGARCYWKLEDIDAAIARAEEETVLQKATAIKDTDLSPKSGGL